jgi:hypothetical protein
MRYLLFLLTTISITSTYIVSSTTFALSIEIDLKTFCSQSPHNTKCKAYDPSNENLQDEKDEKQVNEVLPISINPGSIEPISIAQIQTAIIPGTEIGKLRAGLLHVVQENFYAQGLISTEVQNTYHQIINRELEQFGYSTNTSGNSVGSVSSFSIFYRWNY